MMDATATTAFNNVTVGFFSLAQTQTFFVLLTGFCAIMYVVWLAVSAYAEFGEGQMKPVDALFYVARAIGCLMVILFLIR